MSSTSPAIDTGPIAASLGGGLPGVRKGDPITAKGYNDLVGSVNALARGSLGGSAVQGIIATMLASLDPDTFVQVRVLAVNLPGIGPDPNGPLGILTPSGLVAYLPSTVTYDLEGVAEPGIVLTGQSPVIGGGRPVFADECRIYPVPQGTLGVIIRSPAKDNEGGVDADFVLLGRGEVAARKRCGA